MFCHVNYKPINENWLRCPKVLEQKGSQGPKNDFEEMKRTSPGIQSTSVPNFNMIAPIL